MKTAIMVTMVNFIVIKGCVYEVARDLGEEDNVFEKKNPIKDLERAFIRYIGKWVSPT